jgi:hypothetical protein
MCSTASATIESSPRSMIVSVSGTSPASEFSIGSTARSTSPLAAARATSSKSASAIRSASG